MAIVIKGLAFKCADCKSLAWEPYGEVIPALPTPQVQINQIRCCGCGLVVSLRNGVTYDPDREAPKPQIRAYPATLN